MAVIVNIVLLTQEHTHAPITESVARTILFNSDEAGKSFAKNFREEFLFDGTESRYAAQLVQPIVDEEVELVYTITMEEGIYVLNSELVTQSQIDSNPAILATTTSDGQHSAFTLLKDGEVLELKHGNAGTHKFYTTDYDLAMQMNFDVEWDTHPKNTKK